MDYDLIVVGGGPAGSTLATLVKRHNPRARVLVLDKEGFPRHHVGESLLPGMVHVLEEMGVVEKIKDFGFPKKFGVVFVWGKDRTPWDADFIKFGDELLQKYGDVLGRETTWQVTRAEYDELLLKHAQSRGVEVWTRARAARPLEDGGRIVGVEVETAAGTKRVTCRLLADCSGQNGFLAKYRGVRRHRESLKNVAAYAYFKGARWKYEYTDHPDKTKTFVCSVPEGWFWYIPVSRNLVSVGLISKAALVKERGSADYREFFFSALKSCPELWPLVENAELIKGMDAAEPAKDFFTAKDWSFTSETACGEGWVAAGDAAFFIDPLLSSGVTLAHLSAHRAAYTITTAWTEGDAELEGLLWKDYDRFCKETAGSFLSLIEYWYGSHPNPEMWWKKARRALQASAPLDLSDKGAFIAVIAGLDSLYEKAYADSSSGIGTNNHEGTAWSYASAQARTPAVSDDAVPRWLVGREVRTTFLPISGTGVLRPIHSVRFEDGEQDALEAFSQPRRRTLPLSYLAVIEAIDGRTTVGEIKLRLRARLPLPKDVVGIQVDRLLADLQALAVVSLDDGRRADAPRSVETGSRAASMIEGEDLLARGECARADGALTRAILAGEGGRWAWALRGEARRHLGRRAEALADFDRALAPAPPANDGSRRDALLEEFDDRIRRGWIDDRVLAWRAALRLESGDLAAAKSDADAALKLNPGQFDALKIRAQASRGLGDLQSSLKDLDEVRRMLAGRPIPPSA